MAKKIKPSAESPGTGVAQTHFTVINIIGSTAGAAGESIRAALKEEGGGRRLLSISSSAHICALLPCLIIML